MNSRFVRSFTLFAGFAAVQFGCGTGPGQDSPSESGVAQTGEEVSTPSGIESPSRPAQTLPPLGEDGRRPDEGEAGGASHAALPHPAGGPPSTPGGREAGEQPSRTTPPISKPGEPQRVIGPDYLKGIALIPREKLFGNPQKAAARISPDGKRLAYLAPVDGVLNVWVGPADDPSAARPVTKDTKRGILSYFWAYTGEHVVYRQDTDGDENWHVYCVTLATDKTKDLTPLEGVQAQIEAASHRHPLEMLIGLNDRDPRVHDIYRVNIETGDRQLVEQNTQNFFGYMADDDYRIRFAMRKTPDGGTELLKPGGEDGWEQFIKIPFSDDMTTHPAGFDKTGDILYLIDSRGRNTGALTTVDLNSKEQVVIAENDKADIGGAMTHPTENTIQAVSFNYLRNEWQVLDPSIAKDMEYLGTVRDGEVLVTSRTLKDDVWTVAYLVDDGPVAFYLYDRAARKALFLFNSRNDLEGLPLVPMHPVVIPARDGLELVSYLTLPPGTDSQGDARPQSPLPMVLDVHGGPWARDSWGYNSTAQLWANRGYAVLQTNFRGSTGFGKEFINAGNLQWAGKMHDDLLDAVAWAVEQKIADPARVAIMGGSYGGYATLVGMTFTPQVFACGVDIVGPSNIITLLNSVPEYWVPMIQMFKDRVGDHTTEEGRKFLEERSPLNFVDRIGRPLLIGQGANDPRVKQAEADQIVEAMQRKKIPVTYVLYPDEGHGFARPENRMAFFAVAEAFLAKNLGGRFEPIGDAFKGSAIQVPSGAEQVPGLSVALEGQATQP